MIILDTVGIDFNKSALSLSNLKLYTLPFESFWKNLNSANSFPVSIKF